MKFVDNIYINQNTTSLHVVKHHNERHLDLVDQFFDILITDQRFLIIGDPSGKKDAVCKVENILFADRLFSRGAVDQREEILLPGYLFPVILLIPIPLEDRERTGTSMLNEHLKRRICALDLI